MVSKVNLEPQGLKVGNVILRTLAFLCFVLASFCSTIDESQTTSSKPAETTTVPSIHEFQPTLAAGVPTSEVDANLGTPTAPIFIPVIDPTPAVELIPTTEPIPTLSAERQQLIFDQFVYGPFYDQYIADNQIPEQAATAFYQEYAGVDGQSFAVVTMKVDPASLSKEQKALNIPQRDFLVVKTEGGQVEFKQLPINLQIETFSKSAIEFTLSKEYQKSVGDYLKAMGLSADAVTTQQAQKEINRESYDFLKVEPKQDKLTPLQQMYMDIYGAMPLFISEQNEKEEPDWQVVQLRKIADEAGLTIGVRGLWAGLVDSRISLVYKKP